MVGAYTVEKFQFLVDCPKALVEALEAYRATLMPRPSRNFLVVQCIVEYLRQRGVPIPPLGNDPDA
jgi:hypothetical protein